MLTVAEALEAVLDRAMPLPGRPTALADALGCALAEDVAAASTCRRSTRR